MMLTYVLSTDQNILRYDISCATATVVHAAVGAGSGGAGSVATDL
jgi:hypothetical protein